MTDELSIIHVPDLFKSLAIKVDAALFARAVDPFHVYFDYGHYVEVTRHLTIKEGLPSQQDKMYPLIWLVMDFDENFGSIDDNYCDLPTLQIFIAMPSKPDISTDERMQLNFFPRLYPIYRELMNQIYLSGYFNVINPRNISHKRTLRPYWGGQDGNGNGTANLFNNFIDAIQIRNLTLQVNETVCDTFNILSPQ